MAKAEFNQNDITAMRELGIDLSTRWRGLLPNVLQETNFRPDWERVRQSQWWRTGKIGAVSIHGTFEGKKPAILKLQGVKPKTSEVDQIHQFDAQNKSKIIRSPRVYKHLPWNKDLQLEAIVFEEIVNARSSIAKHPAPQDQLDLYFDLYQEYRANCLNTPWVKKPSDWSYSEQVENWLRATENMREHDSFFQDTDWKLMRRGVEIIENNLSISNLEFMHGHFQPGDLLVVSKQEVVLFSHLFWSWRIPHYDKVFGYHWWMLGMEHVRGLTEEKYTTERQRWLDKIYGLPDVQSSKQKHLLKLAFLERAVPALMVDRLMLDQTKPSAELITKFKRQELEELVRELG